MCIIVHEIDCVVKSNSSFVRCSSDVRDHGSRWQRERRGASTKFWGPTSPDVATSAHGAQGSRCSSQETIVYSTMAAVSARLETGPKNTSRKQQDIDLNIMLSCPVCVWLCGKT